MLSKINKLIPIFILIFVIIGCQSAQNEKSKNNQSVSLPSPTETVSEKVKTNQMPNLAEMIGRSPAELEKKFGKAKSEKKVTDNSDKAFDEEKEFEIAPVVAPYLLIVRFLKGKAVQFIWNLPLDNGKSDAAEFVGDFGFNVKDLKSETFPKIVNWQGTANGVEFEKISAMKMSGDVFSNLTVIVKKK